MNVKEELDMLKTRQYNRLIELTELIEKTTKNTRHAHDDLSTIQGQCETVLKMNNEDELDVFNKIKLGASDE